VGWASSCLRRLVRWWNESCLVQNHAGGAAGGRKAARCCRGPSQNTNIFRLRIFWFSVDVNGLSNRRLLGNFRSGSRSSGSESSKGRNPIRCPRPSRCVQTREFALESVDETRSGMSANRRPGAGEPGIMVRGTRPKVEGVNIDPYGNWSGTYGVRLLIPLNLHTIHKRRLLSFDIRGVFYY